MRFLRRAWRKIFPPRALRIPGKFPWKVPAPLPYGTVLIDCPDGNHIIADGKGGVTSKLGAPVFIDGRLTTS